MSLRHSTMQKIADIDHLPASIRAVAGYYGDGEISLAEGREAVGFNIHIEDRKEESLETLFEPVETKLEREFGEEVTFSYDTKLTFPAELTLGKIYEEAEAELPNNYSVTDGRFGPPLTDKLANPFPDKKHRRRQEERIEEEHNTILSRIRETEDFTDLVTGLLIEGDMRDALHDEEYEDFQTEPDLPSEEVAEIAQDTLFDELQPQLDEHGEGVRDAYEQAVDLSMDHQNEDEEFRDLFRQSIENPEKAESIIEPYKNNITESRFSLDWNQVDLPYFATQYERVGVLYDGMFEMYEEAGIDIDDDFKRSMILSTIGAQVWLDDVDDLEEDWKNEQLTPVTAELLTSDTSQEAYKQVTALKDQYLEAAREYASRSDSHLAGIGIEYIDRKGQRLGLEEAIDNVTR